MPNRLADALSPYLLQHADNPVDWWPWCDEALELAREQDRPILLSIGYAACHWCHVMAHESFEDPETARVMNTLFVNIKVDREERPELDRIYQEAHHLLTRRPGGWPLTAFLDPRDLAPFYSGTYFPPTPRHGLPAFRDLLTNVARAWREQRAAIGEQNRALKAALEQHAAAPATGTVLLRLHPFEQAMANLRRQLDPVHGGFGRAPKFPHPDNLGLLLVGDGEARKGALHTLRRMALGGIFDQLGGGFFRYSVDERWEIPHFEKMLYDNALLLPRHAEAWKLDGDPLFLRTCEATAGWLLGEMRAPGGAFHSSLDADSEGEEGRFYTWSREEVEALLTPEERAAFAACFGLDRPPNFEGRWHLRVTCDAGRAADPLLEQARARLRAARGKRVRPALDDKILTGWNALAIRGLARAGRLLGRPAWIRAAEEALAFLRRHLWREGRLLAVHRGGVSRRPATLDDHAWLIQALLELLQCRWRAEDLAWARALGRLLLERFEDPEAGGFRFTADDHPVPLRRPRVFTDDATPSGNGIAAQVLPELAALTGETAFREAAERTLKAAWPALCQAPEAHASLTLALKWFLEPPEEVVVRAPRAALEQWLEPARARFDPERRLYPVPSEADDLPPPLAARRPPPEGAAWFCRGTACEPPVAGPDAFAARLRGS